MALVSSIVPPHIIEVDEPDTTAHNHNAYEHKIVNADIRIKSIKDETGYENVDTSGEQLVELSQPSMQVVEEHERAEEMQMWWNNAMKKHMDQPDGYAKVAVLLIKWADELDELKTKKEAQELEVLFRNRFHYETKTVELNVRRKPQHQLNSHISDFIRDHDDPQNLLIIYYTGHGVYSDKKKCLELTATVDPDMCKGFSKDARANWNKAEEKLKDDEVEGDVLTILDTCYSSNHVKSTKEDTRKFELLSACAIDQTTAAPGRHSFTRALIDSLRELLDEYKDRPFSTFRILQRINLDKRRSDTPSALWARSQHSEHHIFIAPLGAPKTGPPSRSQIRNSPGGYLTLRFGLRDPILNQEQIESMTKTLSLAFNNKALIGLKEVKWVEMRRAPPIPRFNRVALVMYVVSQWKRVMKKKKENDDSMKASPRLVDDVTSPEAVNITPQKRPRDEVDDFANTKRQYLDPSQPPSPPVSTSSRTG